MLMAMQGQRGGDPKDLKFITATVRATSRSQATATGGSRISSC